MPTRGRRDRPAGRRRRLRPRPDVAGAAEAAPHPPRTQAPPVLSTTGLPDASTVAGRDGSAPARGQLSVRLVATLWVLLLAGGLTALALEHTRLHFPAWLPPAGAVTVSTCYAFALAWRAGGRPVPAGGLALVLAGAAVVTGAPVLLAGAAVGTVVLGAVLGVLATVPAVRFGQAARECTVAALVVAGAALATGGYHARVAEVRAGYLTLGLSTVGAFLLVRRLGAGRQGLGRRGAVVVSGGLVLLAVSLAYTQALARWGSPGLVDGFAAMTGQVDAVLGALPRPTEFLLAFPVLAWGVTTRARRRQGWWAGGFGAAGLAAAASGLLRPGTTLLEAGLSLLYSLLLGLLLGSLVIQADRFLSGARGRRARRAEEAAAHRPEPGRLHPLL